MKNLKEKEKIMKLNIYSIFLTALIFNGCSLSTDLIIPKTEFPLEYQSNNVDTLNNKIEESFIFQRG